MLTASARRQRDEGFTLAELLVVIVVLGILAAIAVPILLSQRNKGWDAQAKVDLKNMSTAQETHFAERGAYTADLAELSTVGFKPSLDPTEHTAVPSASPAYCLSVRSRSTQIWQYRSDTGRPARAAAHCG